MCVRISHTVFKDIDSLTILIHNNFYKRFIIFTSIAILFFFCVMCKEIFYVKWNFCRFIENMSVCTLESLESWNYNKSCIPYYSIFCWNALYRLFGFFLKTSNVLWHEMALIYEQRLLFINFLIHSHLFDKLKSKWNVVCNKCISHLNKLIQF